MDLKEEMRFLWSGGHNIQVVTLVDARDSFGNTGLKITCLEANLGVLAPFSARIYLEGSPSFSNVAVNCIMDACCLSFYLFICDIIIRNRAPNLIKFKLAGYCFALLLPDATHFSAVKTCHREVSGIALGIIYVRCASLRYGSV